MNAPGLKSELKKGCMWVLCSAALITLLVAGLSSCGTYRSFDALVPEEPIPDDGLTETIAVESQKLADNIDRLNVGIDRITRLEHALPAIEPAYDPLENKTVSISMYDADVPKLLWTLADQMGLNLVVDPLVFKDESRASLYLKNVTAREVYNHMMEVFDLKGEVKNGALVVSATEERIFNAGFLGSNIAISIASGGDVFGANSGGEGGGNSQMRADFTLDGKASQDIDAYDQLENAVRRILGYEDDGITSRQQAARESAKKENAAEAAAASRQPIGGGQSVLQRSQISSVLPIAYSLNRLTGSLYVRAKPSQVRSVGQLIELNRQVLRRQVQVEAQLIDVQLSDSYQFGVDWTMLRHNLAAVYGLNPLDLTAGASTLPGAGMPERSLTIPQQIIGARDNPTLGVGFTDRYLSASLKALSSFGTMRVLSNPTVRIRNGTPALLSVGTNIRYISKASSTTNNDGGGASTVSADVETGSLFSGVMVGVLPFVHENGRIELLVHPMQTEVDPNSLALVTVGGGSQVTLPQTSFKGMTTTLNLGSGDIVMIGGLIDQKKSSDKGGLPGLNDIPVVGSAFGQQQATHNSRELVIILRVRLI